MIVDDFQLITHTRRIFSEVNSCWTDDMVNHFICRTQPIIQGDPHAFVHNHLVGIMSGAAVEAARVHETLFADRPLLILPVNHENAHWTLAIIDLTSSTIFRLDSCSSYQSNVNWIIPIVNRVRPNGHARIVSAPVQQQRPLGNDCGLHILLLARHFNFLYNRNGGGDVQQLINQVVEQSDPTILRSVVELRRVTKALYGSVDDSVFLKAQEVLAQRENVRRAFGANAGAVASANRQWRAFLTVEQLGGDLATLWAVNPLPMEIDLLSGDEMEEYEVDGVGQPLSVQQ